jgi:hypothetical protein
MRYERRVLAAGKTNNPGPFLSVGKVLNLYTLENLLPFLFNGLLRKLNVHEVVLVCKFFLASLCRLDTKKYQGVSMSAMVSPLAATFRKKSSDLEIRARMVAI